MKKQSSRSNVTQLLLALATGATVVAAARQVGLTERTVYRRLEDPTFKQRIATTRHDMIQRATGMMLATSVEACKTLLNLLGSSHPATVRLGAGRATLELGIRMREEVDLAERVAVLERQMATPKLRIIEAG